MLYYLDSRIQCGIILQGFTFKSVERELEVRLKNIVRTITGSRKFDHVTPLFKKLKLLKLYDIYQLHLGKFVYQLNWNKLPIINQSHFPKIEDLLKYNTRQAKTIKLFLPRVSKQMVKILSSFRGPQHWSLIQSDIKSFSWTTFKKKYKEYLVNWYWFCTVVIRLNDAILSLCFFCRIQQRLLNSMPVSAA